MSRHPDLDPGGSTGYFAVAQSTIRFCLEPETFPVFLAWVREAFGDVEPDEWFDPELVRKDLWAMHDLMPRLEVLAAALGKILS